MLTKEAIQELTEPQSIRAAFDAVADSIGSPLALPEHYALHDLEKFSRLRRRPRGRMTTSVLTDFAAYVAAHAEPGATVFVDAAAMTATAVLNLGSPNEPGHADNTATFAPPRTAAYHALAAIASGSGVTQQRAAEFFEDWRTLAKMQFRRGDDVVDPAQAIAAVRAITVEKARKIESTELSLSASRSAFESVQASSRESLPDAASFACCPHLGLAERTFSLRLGVRTSEPPQVVLRVVNAEQHAEEMATELVQLVRGAISVIPVVVGEYRAQA